MRLFIAIELPDSIKQGITRVQEQLKRPGANAGWTRPEGIHLTLKFLGEVPDAKVTEIMQALDGAVRGTGRFQLAVAGAGAFPNAKVPRVLWIGVGGNVDQLGTLQNAVEAAMEKTGFEREARKFSPHLTLARVGERARPDERQSLGELIAGISFEKTYVIDVTSVDLVRSQLTRDGAIYTRLNSIKLK